VGLALAGLVVLLAPAGATTPEEQLAAKFAPVVALKQQSAGDSNGEPLAWAITALVNVTAFLAGPVDGIALLFLTSSSLVYVIVVPHTGIAATGPALRA